MCNVTFLDPEFPPVWYMRNSNGSSANVMLFSITICRILEYISHRIYHSLTDKRTTLSH